MNLVIETGRFAKDPEVRYTSGDNSMCVARFTLAVDRPRKGEQAGTDWIQCEAWGRTAEFIEKYFHKGMKAVIEGSIRTGKYEKDGKTNYTWAVNVTHIEFADSKNGDKIVPGTDGFMEINAAMDEELPFK